jgi:CheY-like chemotaxis protein
MPQMSHASSAANPIKLLVVDSDRAFHDTVTEAARMVPGAQIVCCTHPGEALNKLDQFIPTLIIVDGQLNGAAGINFVKRIRSKQTPVPEGTLVLFVAKEFTGGLSGRLCDAGCHGIVRKPVSAKALGAALQRMLAKPIPFVLGGAYLGPDRRAEGANAAHGPERRRTASRGGWTGTPPLFYRPEPARAAPTTKRPPAWKRPPPGTPAPASGDGTAPSAKPARPTAGGMPLVDDSPPAAAKRAPSEPLADDPAPRRPLVRDAGPLVEQAAPAAAEDSFDLMATIEQHRQWIASNGISGARADLSNMTLTGAKFPGQNLAKANFRGANLLGADMSLCILLDADLRNACLAQAALNQSELAGAKIRHADLQFAQLAQAGLQGSDLAGANLTGAVLTGADFAGANLLGTNICGADFTSAVNLTQRQLDRAAGDIKTVLPPGLFVARAEG